jgi:hypothetical protein
MVYSPGWIVDQVNGGICFDGDREPFHIFCRPEMERKILGLCLPSLVAPKVLSRGNGVETLKKGDRLLFYSL